MMVSSAFNAKRFAGKPLRQPLYQFDTVESCKRDLEGSFLYEIVDRDDFVDATAEMVLLCNEATRRSNHHSMSGKRTSKPLSLEYIADRLDIDDPIRGYFVRNTDSKLQGFITCTTFTNWQKTFRWDSVHDSAFSYDERQIAQQMLKGERVYDVDGSLAAELQQTVRCGDPWNEGIVWPQLAEISLLGGLGCGKKLLSLVIEDLETMKPTAQQNYDYVVLQATENSVPFYESMGFIRVGALTIDDRFQRKEEIVRHDDDTESEESLSPTRTFHQQSPTDSEDGRSEIVSSPTTIHVVEKPGESPAEIAKKFSVSVWEIVFLNHYLYKDLNSRSRLIKGTKIYVPSKPAAKADACSLANHAKDLEGNSSAPRWYIASENDTPKMISRKFGVKCQDLVNANIERLPELLPLSRLKEGTRMKVSHFHLHEDEHVPYCHWTFPDDSFDNSEPSYMMARKLNRKLGAAAKVRPVLSSLAIPVSKYVRPPLALFHHVTAPAKSAPTKKGKNEPSRSVEIPGKPKRPLSSYVHFCNEYRPIVQAELPGRSASEHSKVLAARWKELTEDQKSIYVNKHETAKKVYEKELVKYEKNLVKFFRKHPDLRPVDEEESAEILDEPGSLFNKVVTIKQEGLQGFHKQFKYFYVLTYIPDLMWCHLAPMKQVGVWGADKPSCEGRPIWMLVDESMGMELDISASFCIPIKSRGMRRTADADAEQWDIPSSVLDRKTECVLSSDEDDCNNSCGKKKSTPFQKSSSTAGKRQRDVATAGKYKQDQVDEDTCPARKKGRHLEKSCVLLTGKEQNATVDPVRNTTQVDEIVPAMIKSEVMKCSFHDCKMISPTGDEMRSVDLKQGARYDSPGLKCVNVGAPVQANPCVDFASDLNSKKPARTRPTSCESLDAEYTKPFLNSTDNSSGTKKVKSSDFSHDADKQTFHDFPSESSTRGALNSRLEENLFLQRAESVHVKNVPKIEMEQEEDLIQTSDPNKFISQRQTMKDRMHFRSFTRKTSKGPSYTGSKQLGLTTPVFISRQMIHS